MADKKNKDEAESDPHDKSAEAIWNAEFLLIIAGPNFYEDSSKTAFADPLCDHQVLATPDKFFGFWGQYYNRYHERQPHDGYSVLRKWRENFFDAFGVDQRKRAKPQMKKKWKEGEEETEEQENILQRCYVVTTNIDGSFWKTGFREEEIYELFGNINHWQCSIPCKPQVWKLDTAFRFEIDSVLKEAKPIKFVDDVRQDPPSEVWAIVDDSNDKEDVKPKKKISEMNEKEKQAFNKLHKRHLHRLTPIPIFVEHQINRDVFLPYDRFTPTPVSSHYEPITKTFAIHDEVKKPEIEEEESEDGGAANESFAHSESRRAGATVSIAASAVIAASKAAEGDEERAPEQPYILRPRIAHFLAHICALVRNQYTYEEGQFDLVDPSEEKKLKDARFTAQQKFFDESLHDDTAKRQQTILYCISMIVQDADKPTLKEPQQQSNFTPDISSTVNMMSFSTLHEPNSPMSLDGDDWVQGKEGKYYFSYVPIVRTTADPDGNKFDHIHIPFPLHDDVIANLPKRGKISIVVECCILPEKQQAQPAASKKNKEEKKKKKSSKLPRLNAVEEPTKYVACQMVGRIFCSRVAHGGKKGAGSVLSKDSGFSRRDESQHSKHIDDDEEMEYRINSKKGHCVKLGVNAASIRTIKYLGIEVPVMSPNTQSFGVHRELTSEQSTHGAGDAFKMGSDYRTDRTRHAYSQNKSQPDPRQGAHSRKRPPRPVPNHQLCMLCKDLARPHVLMNTKKDMRYVQLQQLKKQYTVWERSMLEEMKLDASKSLVILELGCDKKLESCRKMSERLFKITKSTQRSTLIRISAESLETKKGGGKSFGRDNDNVICIVENVVNTLGYIDRCMLDKTRRK